jgi:hypothetical protein
MAQPPRSERHPALLVLNYFPCLMASFSSTRRGSRESRQSLLQGVSEFVVALSNLARETLKADQSLKVIGDRHKGLSE